MSSEKINQADNPTSDDITVLRLDISGGRTGMASPPKVLKQRFVLDIQLGSGGMGTVFKAKDLRKVEARDRNPYLAIKVLNSDFREHPEAFIALQREASKSQALSHPNIVSIYDFDKEGDTPFMTMELLEGSELAQLIKKYPQGMPDELAWSIITDMCAGLKRAHDAGITHADFKPGNVFVCKDRTSKILDFGIARAVHINRESDENTVFDPAKLAALTPAYASFEMLAGEAPIPVDDIYSLGIVIYQILSGRHPFDRKGADVAEREMLRPERLKRLSRRKWNMLERILSFRRSERPKSMTEVTDKLLQSVPLWYWFAGSGIAAAALISISLLVVDATNITNVKQTAASDALIDAQIVRIGGLVESPTFDPFWEEQLSEEFVQLGKLDEARESTGELRATILGLYKQEMEATDSFEDAFSLLLRANNFVDGGKYQLGYSVLRARLTSDINTLLNEKIISPEWYVQVKDKIGMYESYFPESPEAAFLKHEAGQAFIATLPRLLEQNESGYARELFEETKHLVFDYDSLEYLGVQIDVAHSEFIRKATEISLQEEFSRFEREISSLRDNLPCQSLNFFDLNVSFSKLVENYPSHSVRAGSVLMQGLAQCVRLVGETDQDKAMSIKQAAILQFGENKLLSSIELDPCAMQYLVGSGRQPGRSGFCRDKMRGAGSLHSESVPYLVVVSNDAGKRFAISKQETSWGEVSAFCKADKRCELPANENLPVTGITKDTALSYARWLSERTGYTYRLPTVEEWQLATRNESAFLDPNRNCLVEAAGVERGQQLATTSSGEENAYGLLHTAGNVQEWVFNGGQLMAMGGAFIDPISECSAQTVRVHDGNADHLTGFRLVRVIR
ncbi:MAG: protein kinase [Pseudomonadales bacterium]|nr:protein kinase [Pseudomonadales bacterium]